MKKRRRGKRKGRKRERRAEGGKVKEEKEKQKDLLNERQNRPADTIEHLTSYEPQQQEASCANPVITPIIFSSSRESSTNLRQ